MLLPSRVNLDMFSKIVSLAVSALLLQSSLGAPSPAVVERDDTGSGYKNAAYFVQWGIYQRNYQPAMLPVQNITHLLFAFANLHVNGSVYSGDTYADVEKHYDGDTWDDSSSTNAYGTVKQLFQLKKANRGFKVLLSIGGYTASSNFGQAAASDSSRSLFATSAVAMMRDYGFDGIDIDWEFPANATEAGKFASLLRAVRSELDALAATDAPGYRFQLTIAVSSGVQHYSLLDLGAIGSTVDMVNLMSYDYAGAWDATTGHQASLYNGTGNPAATKLSTDPAIAAYVAGGIPAAHILLGMPLYGRSFEKTDGPGQAYDGVGNGSWEAGIWDYKALPRPGATEIVVDDCVASYSYDAATRELITYDTPAIVSRKVDYILTKGLGGSMFWDASGDRNDDKSLIGSSSTRLGKLDASQNCLTYPRSRFANIAAGLN